MRVVMIVLGLCVLVVGGALLVLPGPGIPIVLVGLGILAREFDWARRLVQRARRFLPQKGRRDGSGRDLHDLHGPHGSATGLPGPQ
jgi:hypothetical protein